MSNHRIPRLKMIQETNCRWRLETESGIVVEENIMIGVIDQAEDYVKSYISSFQAWTYELITLGGNNETLKLKQSNKGNKP